jgi:predicted nucleic acid-binding protein
LPDEQRCGGYAGKRSLKMEKPKIYLETTIFNFPFADDAPQYQADTLRLFEEIQAGKFRPYTSEYVIRELDATADEDKRTRMKKLIEDYNIVFLGQNDEAEQLAAVYIAEEAVKPSYPTDALHIAIATVHRLDFIVSLNFQHILRRKTIELTELINYRMGYKKVGIYSPGEVIREDD